MPFLAAGVGAGLVSGGIGALSSASDRQAALAAQQQAVQQWMNVNIPNPADQQIALQQYIQTGQLSPEMEKAVQQGPSAMQGISTAPNQAQVGALQSLENEGLSGGLTTQDAATLQQQENNVDAAARGRNQSIMSGFQQQGLGGGGLELQAQMAGAQNATQAQGQNSLQAAADARMRALQSIQGAGSLGGQMQAQQFGQQATQANAQDAIARFNAQNMQGVNAANTQAANTAQAYNMQNTQNLANQNTGLANQQQVYNKGLYQQQFNNQAAKASGMANAEVGASNAYNNSANSTAGMWSGLGGGLAKAGTAAQIYSGSQPKDGNSDGSNYGEYDPNEKYAGSSPGPWANS